MLFQIEFLCHHSWKDHCTGMTGDRSLFISNSFGYNMSNKSTALIDDARNAKRFHSTSHAVSLIFREHGFMGLYHGFAGTTLKQAFATAFRMSTYNIMKEIQKSKDIGQSTAVNFANGAVAGVITTYATQPLDTIKTRSQSAKGATTIDACRSVMADYGFRGFWKGTTMRLGRTIFSGGILFTVYERVVAVLNPIPRRDRDSK